MENRKIVVMTGVTRGLGRAMTLEFVRSGHTVCGCGRTDRAIQELRDEYGSPHRFDGVDVADDAAVAAWAGELLADGIVPDLLINNAALINRSAPLWEVDAAEFSDVIDVNIKGVANVLRPFVPAMIAR